MLLEHDIELLKKCRLEIAVKGYASATLASSGGSKSYTRIDLDKLTSTLSELEAELKSLRRLLNDAAPGVPGQIYTIRM